MFAAASPPIHTVLPPWVCKIEELDQRTDLPLSGGEAEPAQCVAGVDLARFGLAVARIQIQPAAPRALEQHALALVRGDLFNMAEVHILLVAAVVATSVIHAHEGSRYNIRTCREWRPRRR